MAKEEIVRENLEVDNNTEIIFLDVLVVSIGMKKICLTLFYADIQIENF